MSSLNKVCSQIFFENVISLILILSLLKPKYIKKVAEDHFSVDFGQYAFGTLVIKLTSQQDAPLIIHLREKITQSHKIDRKSDDSMRYKQLEFNDFLLQEDCVVKSPKDLCNSSPYAIALPDSVGVVMPFRYCEIENLQIPITAEVLQQKTYHNRFNDFASSFTSSDFLLNQVWDICKNTIKAIRLMELGRAYLMRQMFISISSIIMS